MTDVAKIGDRIAYYRRRLGLSQVEFAARIGRSESWVSQVERGVRPVDRISVQQKVADALSISVAELRGVDEQTSPIALNHAEAFEDLLLTLTGHPAIGRLLDPERSKSPHPNIDDLRREHAKIWPLVHGARYDELVPLLSELISGFEQISREAVESLVRTDAQRLLTDTYQATAAALAKLSENGAAWIAADRAAFTAERIGEPLLVTASLFRMAHVFLSLRQFDQAAKVATESIEALDQYVEAHPDEWPALSLAGAFRLVAAITAARDNERTVAQQHVEEARQIATRIGEDRNDFGTEFGPTNVAIHAVAVAVELGDAGIALELANDVNTATMSDERQARFLIDVARAQIMRRQIGEALRSLEHAEQLTPEQTRTLKSAREVAQDLVQLAGPRPGAELKELAERFGVLP